MSDDATPRLALPYLAAGQAQKHLTVNEALARLDGLVQPSVESRTLTDQPAAPDDGAAYLLPAGRTGAEWALHPVGALLRFEAGDWTRLPDPEGALLYVRDEGVLLVRGPFGWVELSAVLDELQDVQRLGIGTTADADNPLAAKLNKALFAARTAAEGGDGDLRLTLNKEGAADVLSLLFQTGFSGRAELGLVGDDALTLKVSADGAAWTTALSVAADGVVRQPKRPLAFVRLTGGGVTPPAAAPATLVFDTEDLDTGGAYDPATGRYTCPVAGRYKMTVGLALSLTTAAGEGVIVYAAQNGARTRIGFLQNQSAGRFGWGAFGLVLDCAAGDQLEVQLQSYPTAADIYGASDTHLIIEHMG